MIAAQRYWLCPTLGQLPQAPIRTTPFQPKVFKFQPEATGIVTGPWMLSYSELAKYARGKKVLATDVGQEMWYDVTPEDRIKRRGTCNALLDYENGFWIPWTSGAFFVEPGAFAPGKDWGQVVQDSLQLRDGQGEVFQACCGAFTENVADANQRCDWKGQVGGAPSLIISTGDSASKALCERGSSGSGATWWKPWSWVGRTGTVSSSASFKMPPKYPRNTIAAVNAARWLDRYSTGRPDKHRQVGRMYLFCKNRSPEMRGTAWGHSYKFQQTDVAAISERGIVQREKLIDEKPILRVPRGEWNPVSPSSRTISYTATQVRNMIREGSWPPADASGLATWLDTNEKFDPGILLEVPREPGAEGGGRGTAVALVGGAVALALALTAGG